MSNQEAIERHLTRNALAKKARIERAGVKLLLKVQNHPDDPRVESWKARLAEYSDALDAIAKGSYVGYNGKPFGAVVGIEE